MLRSTRAVISDLLFLRYCLLGDHPLSEGQNLVCRKCLAQIPSTHIPHLPYGFRPSDDVSLKSVCSYWDFGEEVQSLIHALKYRRKPSLGEQLGRYVANNADVSWLASVDCIMPVPLHPTKRRARGYNQAESIALGVGQAIPAAVNTNVLRRSKFTETQTKLSRQERRENLTEAFEVAREIHLEKDASILLVDDVFTTGATLESAARALRKKYPNRIYGLTLATAPLNM